MKRKRRTFISFHLNLEFVDLINKDVASFYDLGGNLN